MVEFCRIYDSANLQYTLQADIEVLKNIGSANFCYTPVLYHSSKCKKPSADEGPIQIIARKSSESEVSYQMWSFASCDIDQTQFNTGIDTQKADILAQYEKELKNQRGIAEEARRARDEETKLGERLQKAQSVNVELEAERAKYMQENNHLRRELEKMKLVSSSDQAVDGQSSKLMQSVTGDILSYSLTLTTVTPSFPANKSEVRSIV